MSWMYSQVLLFCYIPSMYGGLISGHACTWLRLPLSPSPWCLYVTWQLLCVNIHKWSIMCMMMAPNESNQDLNNMDKNICPKIIMHRRLKSIICIVHPHCKGKLFEGRKCRSFRTMESFIQACFEMQFGWNTTLNMYFSQMTQCK